MKRHGSWIRKAEPDHNCCNEWPKVSNWDGSVGAGSVWECSCGEQYLVVEKTPQTVTWRKL